MPLTLHIITGILGSGKTSTLRHLLSIPSPDGATAIVVGEYAEEGFDAAMLRETGCEIAQVTATGIGSVAKSYVRPVRDFVEDGEFGRIFLETSGVTEIGQVVEDLLADPVIAAGVEFGTTLVVLDAGAFSTHNTYFGDQLWGQVDVGDTVIVNKTDKAVHESLSDIRKRITEVNPEARVVFSYMGQVNSSDALSREEEDFVPRLLTDKWKGGVPADFEAFVYRTRKRCYDRLMFGHKLLNLPVGQIARFKGALFCWDKTYCVNGLPGQLDWDNTPVAGKTAIAFIGLGLTDQEETITKILDDELQRQKDEL